MAEAVFKHTVEQQGYLEYFGAIESFGTSGWHIGEPPDHRLAKTCRKHGVPVQHLAQQITPRDFNRFDYVIAMDISNLADLLHMKPRDCAAKVSLFGAWRTDPHFQQIVDDPYYGGSDGFEINFRQLQHFSEEFLKQEVGGTRD